MDGEHMKPMSYYQVISAMGKEAIKRKKAEGQMMHLAPLGYKNVKINGISTFEIDDEKFWLIEEARKLRKQGWSIRRICRCMEAVGLRSQRGKVIGPSSMLFLLEHRKVTNLSE